MVNDTMLLVMTVHDADFDLADLILILHVVLY